MTTFALIAGMMPVALGRGEGAQFRPAGCGGDRRGDYLDRAGTLVAIPTFYEIMSEAKHWLAGIARKLFGTTAIEQMITAATGEHRVGP